MDNLTVFAIPRTSQPPEAAFIFNPVGPCVPTGELGPLFYRRDHER